MGSSIGLMEENTRVIGWMESNKAEEYIKDLIKSRGKESGMTERKLDGLMNEHYLCFN
jgi:DnaJ-domain-containing protein 1